MFVVFIAFNLLHSNTLPQGIFAGIKYVYNVVAQGYNRFRPIVKENGPTNCVYVSHSLLKRITEDAFFVYF